RAEGAGSPVIFVHGESYSHEVWTEQLAAFSQNHLVITYDRRGHGQSEAPPMGYSTQAHAADLAALMDYFGIESAHLVVHSRAGVILREFLTRYPGRARSLVFADAALGLASPPGGRAASMGRDRLPARTLEQALAQREQARRSPPTRVAQSRPEVKRVLDRM